MVTCMSTDACRTLNCNLTNTQLTEGHLRTLAFSLLNEFLHSGKRAIVFAKYHCTAVRSDMKTSVYALEALNEDFHEREVTIDEPDHDEVLVKIVASGICHSDLNVVNGISPMDLPAVVGHEGTGIVEQVGSLVKGVKVLQPYTSAAFLQELKAFSRASLATRWSYAGHIAVRANDVTEVSAVYASSGSAGIC